MAHMNRTIILDRVRSGILLDAAGDQSSTDPLLTGIDDALLSILLFDQAEITVDNSESREPALGRLQREGLACPVPKDTFLEPMRLVDSYIGNMSGFDLESEDGFTALAQEKSFESIWTLISENDYELNKLFFNSATDDIRMWAHELGGGSSVFDLNFGDLSQDLGKDKKFGLPSRAEFQTNPQFMAELEDQLIDRGMKEGIVDFANELRVLDRTVPIILSKYVEMRGLTDRSASTGFSVCTNFGDKKFELDMSLGADALQLCRIHLSEVRSMPYLESIDDVLRVRGHPYIADFRESIFEWLSRVAAGETNVEEKYRAKIRLANKQIEKLEKWKHLDSPYTLAASISVGVAEIFTGTFFGFGFAVASAAALMQKGRLAREYGYALFRPS